MLRAAARLEKKAYRGSSDGGFWFVISASWLGTFPPPRSLLFSRAAPRSAALRGAPRAPRRTLLCARVVVLDAHAVLARGTGMLARVLSR